MKKSTIIVAVGLDKDGLNSYDKTFTGRGVAEVVPAGEFTWFGFSTYRGLKLEGAIASRLIISIDF